VPIISTRANKPINELYNRRQSRRTITGGGVQMETT
jgi:hypothetical protein